MSHTTYIIEYESVDAASTHCKKNKTIPLAAQVVTPAVAKGLAAVTGVKNVVACTTKVKACLNSSVAALNAVNIRDAQKITGKTIKIAVLDTGVDPTHPDFFGRVLATANFTTESSAFDVNGHGTHVAGTALGSGSVYKGVAPDAYLLSGKVLDDDGEGLAAWLIDGIEWALEQGAHIINLSLGIPFSAPEAYLIEKACSYAVAQGAVVVAAAGNDGPSIGTINSPGSADDVICVGAVTDSGVLASFSSKGPVNGRIKPDICAPGVSITSADIGGGYKTVQGTSSATPHISGLCALLLQLRPKLKPAQIKHLLLASTTPIYGTVYDRGAGVVDAEKLFHLLRDTSRMNTSTAFKNKLLNFGSVSTIMQYGVIDIYSGSQPVSADAAPTGVLLARITQNGVDFVPGSTQGGLMVTQGSFGELVNAGTWILKGVDTGVASWFRWKANAFDNNNATQSLVRVDGLIGRDLILASTDMSPSTIFPVDKFVVQVA